jgi:hypothetical protein
VVIEPPPGLLADIRATGSPVYAFHSMAVVRYRECWMVARCQGITPTVSCWPPFCAPTPAHHCVPADSEPHPGNDGACPSVDVHEILQV